MELEASAPVPVSTLISKTMATSPVNVLTSSCAALVKCSLHFGCGGMALEILDAHSEFVNPYDLQVPHAVFNAAADGIDRAYQ